LTTSKPRECILLADDDRNVAEGLAWLLERSGRTTVVCSDVEAAEVSLDRFPVTHLLCDVQFTGDFGFEGLHFLARVRKKAPHCRIFLMTGNVTESLRSTAMKFGATAVLAKPFSSADLEKLLDAPPEDANDPPYEIIRFPKLEEVVGGSDLQIAFQPIVAVQAESSTLFGYEGLLRVRGEWLVGGPGMLFEYAERINRLAELNTAAIRRALLAAVVLPPQTSVFINVDPITFSETDLTAVLDDASRRSEIPLSRVVLEITERSGFSDRERANRAFAELRARGIRFALDDHGSAYSHLAAIEDIQPSYIKISNSFGTDFEKHVTKERIVRHVASLARDFGCEAILEGVESEETSRAVAAAGIHLAQGYYYGRPAVADHTPTYSPTRGRAEPDEKESFESRAS